MLKASTCGHCWMKGVFYEYVQSLLQLNICAANSYWLSTVLCNFLWGAETVDDVGAAGG
jgi:hypothetical protein